MSAEDIGKGQWWATELGDKLNSYNFGIVCLTRDNLLEPWIHFEAGALSRTVPDLGEDRRVTALLIDLQDSDLPDPLKLFQATKTDKEGMHLLLKGINGQEKPGLDDERLKEQFDLRWPKFEERLAEIIATQPAPKTEVEEQKPEREVLEDILQSVRSHERSMLRLEREVRRVADLPVNDRLAMKVVRSRQLAADAQRSVLDEPVVEELVALGERFGVEVVALSFLSPDTLRVDTGTAVPREFVDELFGVAKRYDVTIAIDAPNERNVVHPPRA